MNNRTNNRIRINPVQKILTLNINITSTLISNDQIFVIDFFNLDMYSLKAEQAFSTFQLLVSQPIQLLLLR